MTLITASEVTAWWLYGKATKPSNLTSEALIRPPENNDPVVSAPLTPTAEFMGPNGPGRFALGSLSALVQEFFDAGNSIPPGQYNKSQMAQLLGFGPNDWIGITIAQNEWYDGKDDYGERTYIWNSGTFKIADDVSFVVDGNGDRYIDNYAVVPTGPDNFNFDSSNWVAQITADYLQDNMDPSRIGRTVELPFDNSSPTRSVYDLAAYNADLQKEADYHNADFWELKEQVDSILTVMFFGDETSRLMFEDKPILYGTLQADTLTAEPVGDFIMYSQFWENGVVLVGGAGVDNLIGGEANDYLLGGADGDHLVGGKGDDKLDGGDGDDAADYSASEAKIEVDLTTGEVLDGFGGTDELISVEVIFGSEHNDEFKAGNIQITIDGGEGKDLLDLSAAKSGVSVEIGYSILGVAFTSIEHIVGSGHSDQFTIDETLLSLDGGAGSDIVDYSRSSSSITLDLAEEKATLSSGTQEIKNIENVVGSALADEILGDESKNLLLGRNGNDTLKGGSGKDILIGGEGDDIIYADDDDEMDLIDGGAGADTFYVSSNDVILNLEAEDKVYVDGVLATGTRWDVTWDTGSGSGNPYFDVGGLRFGYGLGDGTGEGYYGNANRYELGTYTNGSLTLAGPNTSGNIHVLGVDFEFNPERNQLTASGWDEGSYIGQEIVVEGGMFRITRWEGIDHHITTFDPIPDIPGEQGEDPNFPEQEPGGEEPSTDLSLLLAQYGYDVNAHTWDEAKLLRAWTSESGSSGSDQGSRTDPDAGAPSPSNNATPQSASLAASAAAQAISAAGGLISPLALDLDGDGLELTSLAQSKAYFDLDANGFAQRTGWVTGGDGLLAIDTNANGRIDNINELFGAPEPYGKATTNGFDALGKLDSNSDGKIDASDAKFADLRVWIDADEDGLTDTDELKTLNEVGIESISLAATENVSQNAGNTISHTAEYTKTAGGGTGTIADAWFANSTLETYSTIEAAVPQAIMALPALRGYGEVAGLRLTMLDNDGLFLDVQELVFWTANHNGEVPDDLLRRIEQIVLGWTGAENFNIDSRGENIDARHLVALERLTGEQFFQSTGPEGPNPGPTAAAALDQAWSNFVLAAGARILVQSVFQPAFSAVTYVWSTDSFGGSLNTAQSVAALASLAPAGSGAGAYSFWKLAVSTLDEVAEDLGIAPAQYDQALADALSNAGFDLSLQDLRDLDVQAGSGNIIAANEDVTVLGSTGADTVTTGAGDDRIDGGAGNDALNGQAGGDTYILGKDSGQDVVSDLDISAPATDTVQLAAGITATDVLLARSGDDLIIRIAGSTAAMTVVGQFAGTDAGIERIRFASGTEWSRAYIESLLIVGTTGDDELTGDAGNNWIDGQTGADTMTGGEGGDTYVVDDEGDEVVEAANGGNDLVESSVEYVLGDNVEGLVLSGQAVAGTGNALNNWIVGNGENNELDGGAGTDLLAGHLGDDTYVVDDAGDVVVEHADEGTDTVLSASDWKIAANIENLVLTGLDDLDATGNELDNEITGNDGENALSGAVGDDAINGVAGNDTLDGGDGNDTLIGGAGADKMSGGAGHDTYYVDDVADTIVEEQYRGIDVVYASVDHTLGANLEDLTLTDLTAVSGAGNEANNQIVGNQADNMLSGKGGSDTIAGGLGNDTIEGGTGNDSIEAEDDDDTVSGDDGDDTLDGGEGDDVLTGGAGEDSLFGQDGNDTIAGGAGIDVLVGGTGNDTYVVEDTEDAIAESSGQGTDLVLSSVTYVLGNNIEHLTLTGTGDISGTGNTLANVLTGNSGANALDGANGNDTLSGADGNDSLLGGAGNDNLDGGAGADTMAGGIGNDTYLIDDAADVVVEAAGEGTDVVQSSSANYTLADNVETLVLTGTSNINGTGSSGANAITGNAGDNVLDGAGGNDTLDGGDGNDTYLFGYGSRQDQVKDTVGGATPVDILSLAAGVDVEDVNVSKSGTGLFLRFAGSNDRIEIVNYFSGSGAGIDKVQFDGGTSWDRTFIDSLFITGASGNETLNGTTNNDWITGGGGNDQMKGGAGSDTYVVDSSGDSVVENTNEGYDVIESSIALSLASINNVEGLVLITGNINGTGNALDNRIIGSSGNNSLNGGAGNDLLIGGGGNDIYVVDSTGDQTIEHAGEGNNDQVQSSVDWTLSDNIETLTLTGGSNLNGTGNGIANAITGNTGVNTLNGGDGNDTLNGGAGNDTLIGGAGNDVYEADSTNDVVTEADNEGVDLVKASATYVLSAYVENLTLTGSSGLTGTGNTLDNAITGNSGANQLAGDAGNDTLSGGSGVDTMTGGTGNDTYVVDGTTEQVIENADEGTDLVQSSANYTLADNVENLTLTGSSNLIGTGNTLANVITGNSGTNQLNGGDGNDTLDGGSKADTLSGGLGDDVYTVDNTGDQIVENTLEGTDHVNSSVSYVLSANVENLTLVDTSSITGTGNDLDNVITGNFGANTLQGGLGNDLLNGDSHNDTLVGQDGIDTLLGGSGNDILTWDSDDTLVGDGGRDTLLYGEFGTLDIDTAKASNIEVVNLGVGDDNDNGIALSLADVLDLASTASGTGLKANGEPLDLLIYGDNAGPTVDDVDLSGGWAAAGTFTTSVLTGSSMTFNVYQAGGVQVAVQQGLDLIVA
jgi:Ca2+-binding RTX toxin-like protein